MRAAHRMGVYRYEHTEPLFDGRVDIDGVDKPLVSADLISDLFREAAGGGLDIAEYGLTYFVRTFEQDDSPFLALPIFPNRNFRHSALFVNADAGIDHPSDLVGKVVGEFALWGHDPGVWMKGVLHDEYGISPDQMSWVIGGTDHPIPSFDWIPQPVPEGVDVRHAGPDQTLAEMLERRDRRVALRRRPACLSRRHVAQDPPTLPRSPHGGTRLLRAHRHLPDDARHRGPS